MSDRLSVFGPARVNPIRNRMGAASVASRPRLEGCLGALFTARSGSTFLCRQLEIHFDIGRMRESLNPKKVAGRTSEQIASRQDKWFAFKAGLQGVIGGELYGFFDAYLDKTVFILLVRRDLVAQAVSFEKAEQTGAWHSINAPRGTLAYSGANIAKAIMSIATAVGQLRSYARISGRPWLTLIYEDFSGDDFTPALAACDALGVPRREPNSGIKSRPVERVGDETNQEWIERFNANMRPEMRALIETYQAAL